MTARVMRDLIQGVSIFVWTIKRVVCVYDIRNEINFLK